MLNFTDIKTNRLQHSQITVSPFRRHQSITGKGYSKTIRVYCKNILYCKNQFNASPCCEKRWKKTTYFRCHFILRKSVKPFLIIHISLLYNDYQRCLLIMAKIYFRLFCLILFNTEIVGGLGAIFSFSIVHRFNPSNPGPCSDEK